MCYIMYMHPCRSSFGRNRVRTLETKMWVIKEFDNVVISNESRGLFYTCESYVIRWGFQIKVGPSCAPINKYLRDSWVIFTWSGAEYCIPESTSGINFSCGQEVYLLCRLFHAAASHALIHVSCVSDGFIHD